MIYTKDDLKYYIKRDLYSRFGVDDIKKVSIKERFTHYPECMFNITLRKAEYCFNNGHKIRKYLYKAKLLRLGRKLGWTIGLNVFAPGLCIVHYGTVIVNSNAKVGENARIQACVNIGASGGDKEAPQIGDNVYFGPGAKVFGNIHIASNIAIAANAVVNKSFFEEGVTIGGVPAKIISHKGTEKLIVRFTDEQ